MLPWFPHLASLSFGLSTPHRNFSSPNSPPETRRHWPAARIPSRSSGVVSATLRILCQSNCASTKIRPWIDLGASTKTTSTRTSSAGKLPSSKSSSKRVSTMLLQALKPSSCPWTPLPRPIQFRFSARKTELTSSGAIPRNTLRLLTSVLTSQPPSTRTSLLLSLEPKRSSRCFQLLSSLSPTLTIARGIKGKAFTRIAVRAASYVSLFFAGDDGRFSRSFCLGRQQRSNGQGAEHANGHHFTSIVVDSDKPCNEAKHVTYVWDVCPRHLRPVPRLNSPPHSLNTEPNGNAQIASKLHSCKKYPKVDR